MPPEPEAMLLKCEELLDLLYANQFHAKLRSLIGDIEELRDRLLLAEKTGDPAVGQHDPSAAAREPPW